jgi:ADP-heptose:LPS heptosyltransferase
MVSLWGPTRPGFFAPRVESNRILYADYHCSPCVNMFTTFEGMWCNHQAWCMDEITVAQVTEAVEAMLAEAPPARLAPEELSDVETS